MTKLKPWDGAAIFFRATIETAEDLPWYLSFSYTHAFRGLKILHWRMHKFTKKWQKQNRKVSPLALSWWEQWHCELCLTALSSEEEKTLSSDRVIISRLAKCSHCQRKIHTDQYYIYFRLKIVMTASQINDTFGFQSGVKVKVVGQVSGKKLKFA